MPLSPHPHLTKRYIIRRVCNSHKKAEALLETDNLSDTAIFSASFIILLREGLEALLVVLVLLTVLKRAQRKDAARYVHFGWVMALAPREP